MPARSKLYGIAIAALLLSLILTAGIAVAETTEDYYNIVIKVSSGVDLPKGTTVVIKVGDLKKQLTGEYDWRRVYVIYGGRRIPAQVDYLGETEDDYEIVFQLEEPIPAGGSDEYVLLVAKEGIELPAIEFPEVCKIRFVPTYENMTELGPAIILENDLIEAVILNQTDWISGTLFSVKIKATGYDVVKQGREKGSTGWRWSRYMAEGDPDWAEHNPSFEILYESVGPVRAVVVLKSIKTHGVIEGLYEIKKYAVYKGLSCVAFTITVTGPGYKPGLKIPVKVSYVDMGSQGL